MLKKVFALVTNEKKNGDLKFKRYSWSMLSDPLVVLIQFVGDETISEGAPVIHGNSKKAYPKGRVILLPSVAESRRTSRAKPSVIYENLRMTV